MGEFFKRFFYYWRFPIYCLSLFVLFFALEFALEGTKAETVIAVLWLLSGAGFVYTFIAALIHFIKCAYVYVSTGEKEEIEFFEIDLIVHFITSIYEDIVDFFSFSVNIKIRFLIFRILGLALIVLGSIGALVTYGHWIIFTLCTLVIIGGATLWIVANPRKYNKKVEGAKLIPCMGDIDEDELYMRLRIIPTSLGIPNRAEVFGFDHPLIVYGTKFDDFVYIVYKSKLKDTVVLSCVSSVTVMDELPMPELVRDDQVDFSTIQDFDYYSDELAEVIQSAVERAYMG